MMKKEIIKQEHGPLNSNLISVIKLLWYPQVEEEE